MAITSEAREIEWASALVEDGKLTVELSEPPSKRWRERFASVMRLLSRGNGGWGEVGFAKKAIAVDDLQRGAEDDLRHFLESIVVQVNAELAPDDDEPRERSPEQEDPQQTADREMTDRLRAFGEDGADRSSE